MNRPTLRDLEAFLSVASHRSFRKAADELGASPSTLSHAVRGVEEQLGVRLLHRTTRSVAPTEAGADLAARLARTLGDLDAALETVVAYRDGASGTVRINAAPLAAGILVEQVVPRVLARHPGLSIDIVTEGRLVDIVEGGFDAGVRLGETVPRDMIAVPIGGDRRFVCVASPAYLDDAAPLDTPNDLKRHRCISHRMPSGKLYRWEFERRGQTIAVDVGGGVTLDDQGLMAATAAADLGVAYVIDLIAAPYLAARRLRTVLDDWQPRIDGLKLYYPGHRRAPPALRAFIDVLRETPVIG